MRQHTASGKKKSEPGSISLPSCSRRLSDLGLIYCAIMFMGIVHIQWRFRIDVHLRRIAVAI